MGLGGISSPNHVLSTSEIYDGRTNRFVPGPDLPHSVFKHCMLKINQTHFVLVGGRRFNRKVYGPTDKAFIYSSGMRKK